MYVLQTEGAFILSRHSKMPEVATSVVIIWHANDRVGFVHLNNFIADMQPDTNEF